MKVYPVFLAIHPTDSVSRDVKDALLEFSNPQAAASYLFSMKPASTLSRNWDIVVVVDTIAYRFSIDGGVRFIPIKPQTWRTMKRENLDWRYPKIGSTAYSVEEITRKAIQISWPMKYSLYSESAQTFCQCLFESIRLLTIPPKPTQYLTALPRDLITGLNRIPNPATTFINRSKFTVLLTILGCYQYFLKQIPKNMSMPAKQLEANLRWAIELVKAGSFPFVFLAKISMQLVVLAIVLVFGRDFGKAAQDLKGLAEEVRHFEGPVGTREKGEDLVVHRKM